MFNFGCQHCTVWKYSHCTTNGAKPLLENLAAVAAHESVELDVPEVVAHIEKPMILQVLAYTILPCIKI